MVVHIPHLRLKMFITVLRILIVNKKLKIENIVL